MSDQALYELLAKAEQHPNSLTHLERLIWWAWRNQEAGNLDQFLIINAANELEQLQQADAWLNESAGE
jgi:hypothetical protein